MKVVALYNEELCTIEIGKELSSLPQLAHVFYIWFLKYYKIFSIFNL